MSKRYPNHAWNDRQTKAYTIKAAKKEALEAKKKRDAWAETVRVAKEKDVLLNISPSTDTGDGRMLVTKIVHGDLGGES